MKGPSIDAIRRFKEQQELKKREDEQRKIEEKLSILKHRASQGDRKAKQNLKLIEKVKTEAQSKPNPIKDVVSDKRAPAPERPKKVRVETDFEELMKMAKNNNNELRKVDPPPPPPPTKHPSLPPPAKHSSLPQPIMNSQKQSRLQKPSKSASHPHPSTSGQKLVTKDQICNKRPPVVMNRVTKDKSIPMPKPRPPHPLPPPPRVDMDPYRSRYGAFRPRPPPAAYEYEEDEYEDDDFVVDDDDEDAQNELRQTLKSVFRYDKRRCDLREQEIDREYRSIGRVDTFEDLEREERRASRLAAMEDAKALQEEEERKKLKRMRLKKL